MKSMTGYGYSEVEISDGVFLQTEIKSVNRKQLDIKINLPSELSNYELIIRKFISEKVSRGSVMVSFRVKFDDTVQKNAISINSEILKNYIEISKDLSKKFKLSNDLSIKDFFTLPKVVDISLENLYEHSGLNENKFIKALEVTFRKFDKSKLDEGKYLKNHFSIKISELDGILSKIELLSSNLQTVYISKIKEKLKAFNVPLPDENTLARELVIYTDKSDITEELTRLKSHFLNFGNLINSKDPCGRNLDFLIQEIQREINTLGVKGASIDATPLVVLFKTELEKIREQIQNIE